MDEERRSPCDERPPDAASEPEPCTKLALEPDAEPERRMPAELCAMWCEFESAFDELPPIGVDTDDRVRLLSGELLNVGRSPAPAFRFA